MLLQPPVCFHNLVGIGGRCEDLRHQSVRIQCDRRDELLQLFRCLLRGLDRRGGCLNPRGGGGVVPLGRGTLPPPWPPQARKKKKTTKTFFKFYFSYFQCGCASRVLCP